MCNLGRERSVRLKLALGRATWLTSSSPYEPLVRVTRSNDWSINSQDIDGDPRQLISLDTIAADHFVLSLLSLRRRFSSTGKLTSASQTFSGRNALHNRYSKPCVLQRHYSPELLRIEPWAAPTK